MNEKAIDSKTKYRLAIVGYVPLNKFGNLTCFCRRALNVIKFIFVYNTKYVFK